MPHLHASTSARRRRGRELRPELIAARAAREHTRATNFFIGACRERLAVIGAQLERTNGSELALLRELKAMEHQVKHREELFALECDRLPEDVRRHEYVAFTRGGLADIQHKLALFERRLDASPPSSD